MTKETSGKFWEEERDKFWLEKQSITYLFERVWILCCVTLYVVLDNVCSHTKSIIILQTLSVCLVVCQH